MILQALVSYYEILAADDKIDRHGYSKTGINFALELSHRGELLEVHPQIDGSNPNKARRITVPEQARRQGTTPRPYFLCDKTAYVLGIAGKDDEKPEFSRKCFEAFRDFNKELLSKANCSEAEAVIRFLDSHDPNNIDKNPVIARNMEAILKRTGSMFTFMVDGNFVHKNTEIRRVWDEYYNRPKAANEILGQCLITGEKDVPIARLHTIAIKGIYPNKGGVAIVSFDDDAFKSYGKDRAFNAPVSKKAVYAYSSALNHLLSDDNKNKSIRVGDTTVVYWAETRSKIYASLIEELVGSEIQPKRDDEAEQLLKDIAEKIKHGEKLSTKDLFKELDEGFDEDTRFYILGLESPNKGRGAIRFFHTDSFMKIVQDFDAHYEDVRIVGRNEGSLESIEPWRMVREALPKKPKETSKEDLSQRSDSKKEKGKDKNKKQFGHLSGDVFRSILNNSPYPTALYNRILNRIRADRDINNYIRAAIIKGYLKRKYRYYSQDLIKEALTMALNEQATHPAYVLGRLFAVLERAQIEAAKPATLDTTIKDRFFNSFCTSPSSIFPRLMQLAKHHFSKAKNGRFYERQAGEILSLLDMENNNPIPAHFTLDEQGIVVLGYYHQRAFRSNANPVESTSSEDQQPKGE